MARDEQVDAVWQRWVESLVQLEEKAQEPLTYIALLVNTRYVLPQVAENNTPQLMDAARQ